MADVTMEEPKAGAIPPQETIASEANGTAEKEQNGEVESNTAPKKDSESKAQDGDNDDDEKTSPTKQSDRNGDRGRGRDDRDNRNNRSNHRGGNRGGARGRGNRDGGRYGNKFDPSSAKETDDPVEIRKQVEFYFSDSNLPNDKFLFEAVGGSENKSVPIKTLHSFKRMRRFQPFSAVVDALKNSTFLEVVDDDSAVKRKEPLPEGTDSTQPEIQKVFEDKIMSRSVYVKGFGEEKPSTQFDIEAWFSEFGATNQVRLRRTFDSSFKGSVFVEFDSEETAKKFVELDPAPKYNDKDLIIKTKKQYCDEKVDDLNAGKIRGKDADDRNAPDADDWKARKEYDRKNGFPENYRNGRGRRGGNRGRGARDPRGRGHRDDRKDDYGRKRRDDRDDDDSDSGDDKGKSESKKDNDKTESKADEPVENKKREREEDKEDDKPAEKKAAVESDKTGKPEASNVEAKAADE